MKAVCYFTASQERLREFLLPEQNLHFVSFGSINPERLILSEDAQGVSEAVNHFVSVIHFG